ncbi:hypothetical protein DOE76_04375 [Leifsonia sp. ku-ls]|nr:hypothetical protein DOE76_04375 [Leifsonia sp. ku-ls]
MGDRADRIRALRRAWTGAVLTALALVSTAALAVAIPTQGENPRAWGVIVCGLVTVALCGELTLRNRRLLRHYRGEDLPPAPRRRDASLPPRGVVGRGQARAKAAR